MGEGMKGGALRHGERDSLCVDGFSVIFNARWLISCGCERRVLDLINLNRMVL